METNLVATHGLQQRERTHQVRLNEGRRIQQRIVVVRLCGKVDDRVRTGDDAVDQVSISNIALNDAQARSEFGRKIGQRGAVARVCELVQDDDIDIRMVLKERMNEIRSDEAGTAGHNNLHEFSPLRARGRVGLWCRVRSTLPPLCRTSARTEERSPDGVAVTSGLDNDGRIQRHRSRADSVSLNDQVPGPIALRVGLAARVIDRHVHPIHALT